MILFLINRIFMIILGNFLKYIKMGIQWVFGQVRKQEIYIKKMTKIFYPTILTQNNPF